MRTLPALTGYIRDDRGALGRVDISPPDEIVYDVQHPDRPQPGYFYEPVRTLTLIYKSGGVVLTTTAVAHEATPIFDALVAARLGGRTDE